MGEMIGGLIQMNSHMEHSWIASVLLITGATITVVCAIAAICDANHDKEFAAFVMVCAVIGVVMVIVGTRLPKEQIIHACADGQVSLEQVAGRYDIIEVDGKELTLRVR